MTQFKFRALITLDSPDDNRPSPQYGCGTRRLMVRARCLRLPTLEKLFPSSITRADGQPLKPGEQAIVTITVTDDDAPWFLAAGQEIDIWGGGKGHGIISRRVFTDGSPS
jgi:hypothetical protein